MDFSSPERFDFSDPKCFIFKWVPMFLFFSNPLGNFILFCVILCFQKFEWRIKYALKCWFFRASYWNFRCVSFILWIISTVHVKKGEQLVVEVYFDNSSSTPDSWRNWKIEIFVCFWPLTQIFIYFRILLKIYYAYLSAYLNS